MAPPTLEPIQILSTSIAQSDIIYSYAAGKRFTAETVGIIVAEASDVFIRGHAGAVPRKLCVSLLMCGACDIRYMIFPPDRVIKQAKDFLKKDSALHDKSIVIEGDSAFGSPLIGTEVFQRVSAKIIERGSPTDFTLSGPNGLMYAKDSIFASSADPGYKLFGSNDNAYSSDLMAISRNAIELEDLSAQDRSSALDSDNSVFAVVGTYGQLNQAKRSMTNDIITQLHSTAIEPRQFPFKTLIMSRRALSPIEMMRMLAQHPIKAQIGQIHTTINRVEQHDFVRDIMAMRHTLGNIHNIRHEFIQYNALHQQVFTRDYYQNSFEINLLMYRYIELSNYDSSQHTEDTAVELLKLEQFLDRAILEERASRLSDNHMIDEIKNRVESTENTLRIQNHKLKQAQNVHSELVKAGVTPAKNLAQSSNEDRIVELSFIPDTTKYMSINEAKEAYNKYLTRMDDPTIAESERKKIAEWAEVLTQRIADSEPTQKIAVNVGGGSMVLAKAQIFMFNVMRKIGNIQKRVDILISEKTELNAQLEKVIHGKAVSTKPIADTSEVTPYLEQAKKQVTMYLKHQVIECMDLDTKLYELIRKDTFDDLDVLKAALQNLLDHVTTLSVHIEREVDVVSRLETDVERGQSDATSKRKGVCGTR